MTKTIKPILKHLINLNTLTEANIHYLIDRAEHYLKHTIGKNEIDKSLTGQLITTLFFEPSTRTRNAFIIAAKRLNALVLNPDLSFSSTQKGESLIDTVQTFEAMGSRLFILRHPDNNTAEFLSTELKSHTAIINAGDGSNQHPTQALLDLMTIRQYKPNFDKLTVAIMGDIKHSRVARSLITGLLTMRVPDIRLVAPEALNHPDWSEMGVNIVYDIDSGLQDADVVIALRLQKERISSETLLNIDNFANTYGLNNARLRLAKPDAIVMHPGPINRNVEIESFVADGQQSVILAQVRNGIAMRMAILNTICDVS